MSDERSRSGPILRHDERVAPSSEIAHADDERISKHLETHFGGVGMVWHEIVSERIHLDVHHVPATEQRPYQVLVTSGMSALPMTVPQGMGAESSRIELCMLLPAEWPMTQEAFADEAVYWPIRLLKQLGRFPHEFGTWLGYGHSLPNGDPAEPYAKGTLLSGALILPPYLLGPPFFSIPGDPPIFVFQVVPVTAAEMSRKLEIGVDALLDEMDKAGVDAIGPIDPARRSAHWQ
ncbi:MAG: suppressor of fused domain protein [Labilithrix sp.]|nr:suppressor of fused domain protein [Labilithrix sp.]